MTEAWQHAFRRDDRVTFHGFQYGTVITTNGERVKVRWDGEDEGKASWYWREDVTLAGSRPQS